MKVAVALLLLFLLAPGRLRAQSPAGSPQSPHRLEATLAPRAVRLSYLLFLPGAYSSRAQTRWPLLLYLHGGSLRGDNVEALRSLGLPHLLESRPDFPFVVVSPLCPAGEIWSDAGAIEALLERVSGEYRIDPRRVYVTGHSMGGRGALYFAFRLPRRFAGVLALSPYSPVSAWGEQLARTPLWVLHGTADRQAPIAESQELIGRCERAGGHPRWSALAGRDHELLEQYERAELYEWLLAQRLGGPDAPE